MITAIDTNVLLDVFANDPHFMERSRAALRSCIAEGSVVACEVVWVEVATFFPSRTAAVSAMDRIGMEFDPLARDTALVASEAWREYRRRGGRRTRLVADFLIGAHALSQTDRLLTRDRGFYRAYFKRLKVLDPFKR